MSQRIWPNKITNLLWWGFRRYTWVVPSLVILLGKYVELIPKQHLVKFLESGCFPNILFFPLVVMIIIVLSHACDDSKKRIRSNYPIVVLLQYLLGILVIVQADWVSLNVFGMMLFPESGLLQNNPYAQVIQFLEEYPFSLGVIPLLDGFIFKYLMPKYLGEIRTNDECLFCKIITTPRKYPIAYVLGLSMISAVLIIIC